MTIREERGKINTLHIIRLKLKLTVFEICKGKTKAKFADLATSLLREKEWI